MEKENQQNENVASSSQEREELEQEGSNKKTKNLISALIILSGLLLGSLFVDVMQLIRGKGFSPRVLKQVEVFSYDGKTWVAFTDPIVKINVVTDGKCESCDPSQPLVWLRRALPTIMAEKIEADSEQGKKIIEQYKIKSIPAFIFDKQVEKTEFFSQAKTFFEKIEDGNYVLLTGQIGIPAGRFLVTPEITDQDAKIGSPDAKVKLIEFSDFQCPYCKSFQTNTINKILDEYKGKIFFVFKNMPLDFHSQAKNAALAAACANEQGKFETYARKLFEVQEDWGQTEGTQKFKNYAAQLGLKTADFNQCLDSKKYESKIEADMKMASDFGISGTPALFINNQLKAGAVSYEEVKKIIEEELSK